MSATAPWPPEETEICNDDGFVYKRRKRDDSPPPPLSAEAAAAERRRRRKAALLKIKERYSSEMERWERFSSAVDELSRTGRDMETSAPETVAETPDDAAVADVGIRDQIEELLREVKAQEVVIDKLSDVCDVIDSLCDIREEAMTKELLELPIWTTNPRSLLAFLSD